MVEDEKSESGGNLKPEYIEVTREELFPTLFTIDPTGPGRMRYGKKIRKARREKMKRLKYKQLIAIKKGKAVPVTIPVYHLPKIKYGPRAGGVGVGPGEPGEPLFPQPGPGDGKQGGSEAIDAIYGDEITRKELVNWMKDELQLDFIKPSKTHKRERLKYPAISNRGDDSLLNLEESVEAMIERQIAEKKLKPGKPIKLEFEEDDLRYNFPKVTYKEEKDAIAVFMRDVSGSIGPQELEASYLMTLLVQLWLEECYPEVTMVYIAHNAQAWEETEDGYYNLQSGGGTEFSTAYGILGAMMEGKDYPRKTKAQRKINPEEVDVYVLHMTDGENWGNDVQESADKLKKMMKDLTRFCYMEEHFSSSFDSYSKTLEGEFKEEIGEGKVRIHKINDPENVWDAMKTFYGKGK